MLKSNSIQAVETIYYLSYSDGLHPSNTPLPNYVSQYPASRVSSACSCLVTPATVTGHPVPGYMFYVCSLHYGIFISSLFEPIIRPNRNTAEKCETNKVPTTKIHRPRPRQRRPPTPCPHHPPSAPTLPLTAATVSTTSPPTKSRARTQLPAPPHAAHLATATQTTKTASHGPGWIILSCA